MDIQANPLGKISEAVAKTIANETGIEIATLQASQTLVKAEGKINESINSASNTLSSWEGTLNTINDAMTPIILCAAVAGTGGAALGATELFEEGSMAAKAAGIATVGTYFFEAASYAATSGLTGWRIFVEEETANAKKDVSLDQTAATSLFKTINSNGSLVKETLETERALGTGASEFMRQMTRETISFKG